MTSTVGVTRIRDGGEGHASVLCAVREAMERANWRDFVSPQADVSLKVNLGWDLFLPGCVTSPWVVEGVIQTIRDHVGNVYIVESDQILVDSEKALKQTHIDRLCAKYGVEWVNMSKRAFTVLPLNGGSVFTRIEVPEILLRTELITIPVMKTHDKTIITGAMKNQWGCLPKLRHNYHLVVDEALADINAAVKPRFAVMDATVGLDGNSPKSGRPRVVDLVLASGDPVALDTVAAKLMGFDPQSIQHLNNCARRGLGRCDLGEIDIRGEDIADINLRFQPADHNLVSVVELLLRKSFFRKLVFETIILDLCCWGAKVWYFFWYYVFTGRKLRDSIVLGTRYGEQWKDE